MIGVVSWTIAIGILGIHVSVLVKIGGIWSSICSLGSGVGVEVVGLGIFSVLFALFISLSIVMKCIVVKSMYWRRKKRQVCAKRIAKLGWHLGRH